MSFAQTNPERVIITTTTGQQIGALADRVVDIQFPSIEGRVACDTEILSLNEDGSLTVNMTRTEACQSVKLTVMADGDKSWYRGDRMVEYVDKYGSQAYYQDFSGATLSGIETKPGVKYWVITLGYDIYNIPCEIAEAEFTVPTAELEGNPQVTTTVTGTTKDSFSLHFEPNEDCSEYFVLAGETGTLASQYNMFAAWMGFSCFEDMIAGWGLDYTEAEDYTYKNMAPGTEYEVFVLPLDLNGTYGQYETILVSTDSQGGDGEAKVDVSLGAYEMTDGWWDNDAQDYVSKPSQMITFTPNDQCESYRYAVVRKEFYEEDKEGWDAEVAQDCDPAMPIVNWYQYESLTTDFQIDPETDYVVLTAGKNAKGEWGAVEARYYTTPKLDVASAPSKKIVERKKVSQKMTDKKGVAPLKQMNRVAGLRLTK